MNSFGNSLTLRVICFCHHLTSWTQELYNDRGVDWVKLGFAQQLF